ncbi:MAG: hypothetical protein GWP18_05795, partial [Proteobacteria bacterium]|nr:hypothetical protein [Pseudomonadota bacterium]
MRIRLVLLAATTFLATFVPVAGAAETPVGDTTADILAPSDELITVDLPRDTRGFSTTSTAAYSDPLGLIDYYEFTSLYAQGTDTIAVYTCPAYGAVTSMTAAQAVAIGNGEIKEQFNSMSEGVYNVNFVVG